MKIKIYYDNNYEIKKAEGQNNLDGFRVLIEDWEL